MENLDWLDFYQARKEKLGTSEIGKILSIGGTRINLMMEKLFQIDLSSSDEHLQKMFEWGKKNEKPALDFWRKLNPDHYFFTFPYIGTYDHPLIPKLVGTPDALCTQGYVLEIKCPCGSGNFYDAKPYNQLRLNHFLQVQGYLDIMHLNGTEFTYGLLLSWTYNNGYSCFIIERDNETCGYIRQIASSFIDTWDYYKSLKEAGVDDLELLKIIRTNEKVKNKREIEVLLNVRMDLFVKKYI